MNNSIFEKTVENVRKHRDNLFISERRRNYLVSEPHHHTTKFFTKYFLAIEMKKTEILMNKPVHLKLSILELSKILIYEFWYDYVKPKYGEKPKLCYMNRDSFIVHIKTNYIYKDIGEDAETRFDTLNHELDRLIPRGKNKKVIGSMKDELGGEIMINFVGVRAITYSYLIDDRSEDKKAKGTKKCVIKRKLELENYKNWLQATKLQNEMKYLKKN